MEQDVYSMFIYLFISWQSWTWFLLCVSSLYKEIMYFRRGLNDFFLLLFFRVYVVFNNRNWLSNKSYNKCITGWFLPCEQGFLSCTAFSFQEVVRIASQSFFFVLFLYAPFLLGHIKQTNFVTDKRHEWLQGARKVSFTAYHSGKL